jgi:RNA polymerase sigma-70 factor (ECF subfamily)
LDASFIHINKIQLQQIALGNEQAFRELFEQNWQQIYGVAFAFTKSSVMAEEIVQDIFLKIWLKKDLLVKAERPAHYLFIFIRNHILNELRKKVKEETFIKHLSRYLRENEYSPEDQFILKESEKIINDAVARLPPRQQLIYRLSRQHGLNQEDIAKELHISKNTVKSHMNKALAAIRNHLRAYAGEISVFVYFLMDRFFY